MVIGKDVHVEHSKYRGKDYVMIRRFYEDSDGEFRPGRQGINLKWEEWEQLVENFDDIKKEIDKSIKEE
jgi:hypothetical protein